MGIEAIRARRGVTLDMGPEVTAEILWPAEPLLLDGSQESHNDNSIVIRITHEDGRF